jgi:hypothetical protein
MQPRTKAQRHKVSQSKSLMKFDKLLSDALKVVLHLHLLLCETLCLCAFVRGVLLFYVKG